MNINDLTTAQIETILRFRHEFPDVKVWPSGEFGVVLVQTQSAGEYRVGRVDLDGGAPLGRPSPGRPSMPEGGSDAAVERRCPMTTTFGAIPCELAHGHNSPHENNENGKLTWESVYVADLRRKCDEVDDWKQLLRDVLDDLGDLKSESIDYAREALDA